MRERAGTEVPRSAADEGPLDSEPGRRSPLWARGRPSLGCPRRRRWQRNWACEHLLLWAHPTPTALLPEPELTLGPRGQFQVLLNSAYQPLAVRYDRTRRLSPHLTHAKGVQRQSPAQQPSPVESRRALLLQFLPRHRFRRHSCCLLPFLGEQKWQEFRAWSEDAMKPCEVRTRQGTKDAKRRRSHGEHRTQENGEDIREQSHTSAAPNAPGAERIASTDGRAPSGGFDRRCLHYQKAFDWLENRGNLPDRQ